MVRYVVPSLPNRTNEMDDDAEYILKDLRDIILQKHLIEEVDDYYAYHLPSPVTR